MEQTDLYDEKLADALHVPLADVVMIKSGTMNGCAQCPLLMRMKISTFYHPHGLSCVAAEACVPFTQLYII